MTVLMKTKLFAKTKTTIIAIAAVITINIVNAQDNPRVMILDFEAGAGITQSQVSSLSSILTAYLQEEFDVVSLEEIDKVISEQGFQRATMTEQQMEMVDSLLNVSKIVTGTINATRGQYRIRAGILNVETATTEAIVEGAENIRRGLLHREPQNVRRNLFHHMARRVAQDLLLEMRQLQGAFPQEVTIETLLGEVVAERGVLINGIRWATSNVDIRTGAFAPSPEMAGRLSEWGSQTVWGVRDLRFVTPTNAAIEFVMHDWIQRDPCPPGWRVPYRDEFESLIAAGSFWTTVNGVNGRVFGTAPNQIFLPAAGGGGIDPTMDHIPSHVALVNEFGFYWTRNGRPAVDARSSVGNSVAWRFRFSQTATSITIEQVSGVLGHSIRCVVQTDNIYVEF